MVKVNTSLAFYGGVNEIGGNKILLQDRGTKIFLDFGLSFALKSNIIRCLSFRLEVKKSLQELGILPKLKGFYKFDEKTPEVNAAFLFHGHLDHSAYISFINREIPVYCWKATKITLQTLSQIRTANLEFNVKDTSFKSFRTGDTIALDDLEIEPLHVDHSVPGAYGFIIYTSKGAVVYTRDFRAHGTKSEMTSDFVEKAKGAEPVAVITKATNMTGALISSEREVENKLNSIVEQASGLVLADFAYADVDRLNSFHRTAKKNKQCSAVSLKQAYMLKALREDKHLSVPDLDDENILIFRKSKKRYRKSEKQIMEQY